MWLRGENCHPHIKRGDEERTSHEHEFRCRLGSCKILQDKNRSGKKCEHKPDIKINEKVTKVEIKGFCAKYLWTSSRRTENVIKDKVPRNNQQLVVKESFNACLERLSCSVNHLPSWTGADCFTRTIAHLTIPSRNLRPVSM